MNKLTAIKIKYNDGTYSDEIPVSALAENVKWDNTYTLVDVLGSIDVSATGTIQDQISRLFNEKASTSAMQSYVSNNMNTYITQWLRTNVKIPENKAIALDSSLTISGAAADAKAVGQSVDRLRGGTRIPAESDLNQYTEVGNYYVKSNADAATLSNCPTVKSGLLKIYDPQGDSAYIMQHYLAFEDGLYREYKRYLTWTREWWSDWVPIVNDTKVTNKLTVMSYNVQWFSGRNANVVMQDAIIRKFNPDIIGLQELREYTPAANDVSITSGMDVWSTIFKDYKYTHLAKEGNANYKGNASKFKMTDIVDKAFDVSNDEQRGYTKCYITINGKKICWINTHLSTTSSQADKIAQAHQIVELVENEPYFIVTGDFNTRHEPELGEFNSIMKPFLDIGANTANFKAADNYIFTYCDGRDFSSGNKYPHDHIITSSNITIDKVFADDTKYMSMFMDSNPLDHVPLVAFLTIN